MMKRRNLFKGLLALPIFGTIFAAKVIETEKPERLSRLAMSNDDIWIEANLPFARYAITVEENQEVKPGQFVKKVTITKVV